MSTANGRSAFTLVELLVVVAIIGLLLSILLPALSRAQDAAKLSQCGSNLRQLAVAVQTYGPDHDDHVPAGPRGAAPPTFGGREWIDVNGAAVWLGDPFGTYTAHGLLLERYLADRRMALYCPDDQTVEPEEELGNIHTAAHARASYAYRHLSQTSRSHVYNLGVNDVDHRAKALFVDAESYGPRAADLYHSAHDGRSVNIAYLDGHVQREANTDQALAVTADAFGSLPDLGPVFDRGDQVFVNADYALVGEPGNGPELP